MDSSLDLTTLAAFVTSLLIGALVGLEREKRKALEGALGVGGIRTFIVIALLGSLAGFTTKVLDTPIVLLSTILAVALTAIGGSLIDARRHAGPVGLTTEFAAVVMVFLGALPILGHSDVAVVLGIVTATVLAYKQPLHGLVEKIGWDDILAMLRFLIASFIILPLLPNRTLDPLDSLNPYKLWLLVIVISSLSVLGYVAARWFGERRGVFFAGVAGGLVSSTAVTISFARQSRERAPQLFLAGLLLAWAVMFGRVVVLAGLINASVALSLAIPFGAMAFTSLAVAFVIYLRGKARAAQQSKLELRNPFSLRQASKFAALFAVIVFAVAAAKRYLPAAGTYVVAAVAGLTDVDAITLSMAEQAKEGAVEVAALAILIGTASNTLVKWGIGIAIGPREWRTGYTAATCLILAVGCGALFLKDIF